MHTFIWHSKGYWNKCRNFLSIFFQAILQNIPERVKNQAAKSGITYMGKGFRNNPLKKKSIKNFCLQPLLMTQTFNEVYI